MKLGQIYKQTDKDGRQTKADRLTNKRPDRLSPKYYTHQKVWQIHINLVEANYHIVVTYAS